MKIEYIKTFIKYAQILFPRPIAQWTLKLFMTPYNKPRSERELKFWNQGADFKTVSGCSAKAFGNPDHPEVWFVHGWESRGSKFETAIKHCVESGLYCVAWDAPAHGDSPGKQTNLKQISNLMLKDMHTRNKKLRGLVGHSLGGAASAYVSSHGAPIENLVMIASPTSIVNVFNNYFQFLGLSEKTISHFHSEVKKRANVTAAEVQALTFYEAMPSRTLLIHDKDDAEVPFSAALALKRLRPEFELFETQGLGHRKIIFDQAVVKRIVDQLTKIPDDL